MRRKLSRSRSPSPSRHALPFSLHSIKLSRKAIMARLAVAGAVILLVVFLVQFSTSQSPDKLKAAVVLAGNSTITGVIRFEQDGAVSGGKSNPVHITGQITGKLKAELGCFSFISFRCSDIDLLFFFAL